ncbi:hypothetical protein D3C72_1861450 [compost metagenome]
MRDRIGHAFLLRLQGLAQPAQVAVIAALFQILGDRALRGAGRGQRRRQLQALDALRVASRAGPADAVARRQAL